MRKIKIGKFTFFFNTALSYVSQVSVHGTRGRFGTAPHLCTGTFCLLISFVLIQSLETFEHKRKMFSVVIDCLHEKITFMQTLIYICKTYQIFRHSCFRHTQCSDVNIQHTMNALWHHVSAKKKSSEVSAGILKKRTFKN